MGCYHTKQTPGLRCHQCKAENVNNFLERLCYGCTLEALRPVAKCEEKPYFGEYRCGACTWTWVSRVCWPRCYQACKRCRRPTYACKWRELTAADRSLTADQEHEREFCQKCQQVGYYCGKWLILQMTMELSLPPKSCSCDDKNDEIDYDYFPNAVQIWGMFGTILVVGVCWILFSRMKQGIGRLPPPEMLHFRMKRPRITSRSGSRQGH